MNIENFVQTLRRDRELAHRDRLAREAGRGNEPAPSPAARAARPSYGH